MKLALTLEADSINVQALNMGRIVVDIDGVNLCLLYTSTGAGYHCNTPRVFLATHPGNKTV